MRPKSPLRIRTQVGQYLQRSASTNSLPPKPSSCSNHKSPPDVVAINKENYRLSNQCKSLSKTVQRFEERIEALKSENDRLKTERNEQQEVLKKIKAKFLYVPDSEVLSRQCIELKAKADRYKNKCGALRKANHKLMRQNKAYKAQLQNTNTALHNLLSKKYLILSDASKANGCALSVDGAEDAATDPSSVCVNPVTSAMQRDIDSLEKLIENLDYAKSADPTPPHKEEEDAANDAAPENKEYLNVEKILFEHGSLQNDNRDLAMEVVVHQETNAKLAQSVNDLWLFSNQLLLRLEKQSTWKNYAVRKIEYIREQLVTFKKMYHRTRFYFVRMAVDHKKQILEMSRIVDEVLQQNAGHKEELGECSDLKLRVLEFGGIIEKYEAQLVHYKEEKRSIIDRYESILSETNNKAIQHQNERDLLLQKLDSLMTKHSITI